MLEEVLAYYMPILCIGSCMGFAFGGFSYVIHICISQVCRIFKQIS